MKNVSLIGQLEGETRETSIDIRRRKYFPKYTSVDQDTRQRLNTGGCIIRDSMTLHERIP